MRLRNPGTITAAITAVQYLRMQLDSARNQGHGAAAHQDAFLAWCDNQARPYLRNCFAAGIMVVMSVQTSPATGPSIPPEQPRQHGDGTPWPPRRSYWTLLMSPLWAGLAGMRRGSSHERSDG